MGPCECKGKYQGDTEHLQVIMGFCTKKYKTRPAIGSIKANIAFFRIFSQYVALHYGQRQES